MSRVVDRLDSFASLDEGEGILEGIKLKPILQCCYMDIEFEELDKSRESTQLLFEII